MAIDSRDKRAGAIAAGVPFIVISPLADGTISAADRQQIVNVYPGITAGEPVTGIIRIGMMIMEKMRMMELMPY